MVVVVVVLAVVPHPESCYDAHQSFWSLSDPIEQTDVRSLLVWSTKVLRERQQQGKVNPEVQLKNM